MVLRLYHVLLGCAMLVLVPLGMRLTRLHTSTASNLQPTPIAQPYANKTQVLTTSNLTEGNIWRYLLGKTGAPPDWRVAPCEENGPLLCVFAKEKRLGTVEMGVYPLGQQLDFQKMLVATGIPLTSKADYQSPKYKTQVSAALQSWIAEQYKDLLTSRQVSYGKSITFSEISPQQVLVGKLPGIRYEFVGRKRQNGVYEQHLGYVAFDGSALYVITTAFNPTLDTGKFETLEDFQRFEPHLSLIVANLRLPR